MRASEYILTMYSLRGMRGRIHHALIVCRCTQCLNFHIGLMMQRFLSLEILFLTLITTVDCITCGCNFTDITDIINVSLRLGHDFSTMI